MLRKALLTEFVAAFLQTPPANQKSLERAAGIPPFSKKYRATAAPAPLRDATSPAPPEALQYPAAIFPRNARAKIARKKTPPRAADTPNPAAKQQARIVRSSP